MKKIFTLLVACITVASYAQSEDTTRLNFGSTRIIVIQTNEEGIEFDEFDISDTISSESSGGSESLLTLDIGTNGFLTAENSLALPNEYSLMELDYSKSRSIAFNMMFYMGNMRNTRAYIAPGIGLDYKSYFFKNNIQIGTNNDTVLFALDTVTSFDKYKLRATYLQVPVVVGLRLGNLDKKPITLETGVIGGYRIGSRVKQKFQTDDTKYKNKIKDDFNLSPFKLSATARIGIGNVGIFANYGLTSLFEKNKAPELNPFTVGITLGGF